jgi:acetyl esterase/lipase
VVARRATLASFLALAGCSPARLLNLTISTRDVLIERDLPYGDGPQRRLDVYRPRAAAAEPAPTVVFIHGGRWQAGAKGDFLFVGQALASAGFVTVIPDYRHWPDVTWRELINDAEAAARWAVRESPRLGGDPSRLFLAGHSSGAHTAAMLAVDPARLAGVRPGLRGLIGISGPYDFLPARDADIRAMFAGVDPALAQPVGVAGPGRTPDPAAPRPGRRGRPPPQQRGPGRPPARPRHPRRPAPLPERRPHQHRRRPLDHPAPPSPHLRRPHRLRPPDRRGYPAGRRLNVSLTVASTTPNFDSTTRLSIVSPSSARYIQCVACAVRHRLPGASCNAYSIRNARPDASPTASPLMSLAVARYLPSPTRTSRQLRRRTSPSPKVSVWSSSSAPSPATRPLVSVRSDRSGSPERPSMTPVGRGRPLEEPLRRERGGGAGEVADGEGGAGGDEE